MPRIIFILALLAAPLVAQIMPFNSEGVSMGHIHLRSTDPDAVRSLFIDVLGGAGKKVMTDQPIAMFPGVFVSVMNAEPGDWGTWIELTQGLTQF